MISFGAAELWTLESDAPGRLRGRDRAASNERLYLPDIHPAGAVGIWVVVEVAGVEVSEVFISHGGIQGATGADRRLIMPVSVTADALIRIGFWPRSAAVASYIQLTGNSDTLAADTVAKVYLAVVRGAAGSGGGGGGGSNDGVVTGISIANDGTVTVTRSVGSAVTASFATGINALIAAAAILDSQIPAGITRDTEFGRLRRAGGSRLHGRG